MADLNDRLRRLGIRAPKVLLPAKGVDLHRWAVIACDQHTSEPDYWEEVESTVGESPSTLKLVLPEVYLGEPDEADRIESIHSEMARYLSDGTLAEMESGFVLTIRTTPHVSERRGLLVALDLEEYDYNPGSGSLIRPTERTILERIPPRVRVRRHAPLELPHVMVLIDDPEDLLFSSLTSSQLVQLYETELMLGGGRVAGYRVDEEKSEEVISSLEELLSRQPKKNPLLFAVGDGNHSLATAKYVWEELKPKVGEEHPARFAMVELVNLYDPGLRFEPIHRLVRTDDPSGFVDSLAVGVGGSVAVKDLAEVGRSLRNDGGVIGFVHAGGCGVVTLADRSSMPVIPVQDYLNNAPNLEIDYIHGWDASIQLAGRPDSLVLLLPEFNPRLLYPTVRRRGVLPQKAFSLGEPEEKRYYLEVRRITEP